LELPLTPSSDHGRGLQGYGRVNKMMMLPLMMMSPTTRFCHSVCDHEAHIPVVVKGNLIQAKGHNH
jgi:hypothetical protein